MSLHELGAEEVGASVPSKMSTGKVVLALGFMAGSLAFTVVFWRWIIRGALKK